MPLLFLSENTKQAMFAQEELNIFYREVIYQQSSNKNWFLVKTDDVDLDEIYRGLGGYKYFSINDYSIEDLYKAVYKKLYGYEVDETMA